MAAAPCKQNSNSKHLRLELVLYFKTEKSIKKRSTQWILRNAMFLALTTQARSSPAQWIIFGHI
jgi:hypothetical protein